MTNDYTQEDIDRFWEKVNKTESCWLWTGGKSTQGYGVFRYHGPYIYSHRFSYLLKDKEYDQSLCVLHSCDKPSCVNPDHLFLGTQKENMQDKLNKNRQAKGLSISGVLTEEDALSIIDLYKQGNTQRYISSLFNINQSQVSKIVSGSRWGHLKR